MGTHAGLGVALIVALPRGHKLVAVASFLFLFYIEAISASFRFSSIYYLLKVLIWRLNIKTCDFHPAAGRAGPGGDSPPAGPERVI